MAPAKKDPDFERTPPLLSAQNLFSGGLLSVIASGVWACAWQAFTIKSDLASLKASMWSRNEQRQFANELQWGNSSSNLKVPDTDQIAQRYR